MSGLPFGPPSAPWLVSTLRRWSADSDPSRPVPGLPGDPCDSSRRRVCLSGSGARYPGLGARGRGAHGRRAEACGGAGRWRSGSRARAPVPSMAWGSTGTSGSPFGAGVARLGIAVTLVGTGARGLRRSGGLAPPAVGSDELFRHAAARIISPGTAAEQGRRVFNISW